MKASELIKEIQDIIDEHGDLDVGLNNAEFNSFDAVSIVYFKESEDTGNIYTSDSVGKNGYFIAIE